MKKCLCMFLAVLLMCCNSIGFSAITNEYDLQSNFYHIITFYREINTDYYLEIIADANCYGGQTNQGFALASIEYDHAMLANDSDMGTSISVSASAGNSQNTSSNLYPDETKREINLLIREARWNDFIDSGE
ncbi:MAG: hypothetical protein IJL30_01665 [Clostridia bacterium]|nr:hypothetical protein [Clostridia bacterium]